MLFSVNRLVLMRKIFVLLTFARMLNTRILLNSSGLVKTTPTPAVDLLAFEVVVVVSQLFQLEDSFVN